MATVSSNSSYKRRQQLVTDYVVVQAVISTVDIGKYLADAEKIFLQGNSLFEAKYFLRSYIEYKRYGEFVLKQLPTHKQYDRIKEERTKIVQNLRKVQANLEVIACKMDEEEDERIRKSEALKLIEAFDEPDEAQVFDDFLESLYPCEGALRTFPSNYSYNSLSSLNEVGEKAESSIDQTTTATDKSSRNMTFRQCVTVLNGSEHSSIVSESDKNEELYKSLPKDINIGGFVRDGWCENKPVDRLCGVQAADVAILNVLKDFRRLDVPRPYSSRVDLRIGEQVFGLQKDDFQVLHTPFLKVLSPQLLADRSAVETNRCFFLHLGVATQLHPFCLQVAFRHMAEVRLRDTATEDMSYDLLTSVVIYAGFVDANCLIYLWPEEFDSCRICVISGSFSKPIFSCFLSEDGIRARGGQKNLRDVIIHCSGSHFTLLGPPASQTKGTSFSILNDLLFAARNAGLVVQENIVRGGMGRWSVVNTLKGLQSASQSKGREL